MQYILRGLSQKHCETYCVLTLYTKKLTNKNMRMHESPSSTHNHITV